MKIVINDSYGGFTISEDALKYMGVPYRNDWGYIVPIAYQWLGSLECRTNEKLIEFIEKFGSESAGGSFSNLVIKEVPKGTLFRIQEYDGSEWVETADEIDWWKAI